MNSIQCLSKPQFNKSERSYQATPRSGNNKDIEDVNVNDLETHNINNINSKMLRKTRSNVTIRENNNYYKRGFNEKEQGKRNDHNNNANERGGGDNRRTPHLKSKPYIYKENNSNMKFEQNHNDYKQFERKQNNTISSLQQKAQDQSIAINDITIKINENDNENVNLNISATPNNSMNKQQIPKYYLNNNSNDGNLAYRYQRNHFNHTTSRPLPHHSKKRERVTNNTNTSTNRIPFNNSTLNDNNTNNNNNTHEKNNLCVKIVQELIDIYSTKTNEVIQPENLIDRLKCDHLNNQTKDDFINSVYRLYSSTMPPDQQNKTDIGDLWEWIQSIHLNSEINIRERRNESNDVYRNYCEGIMEEYDLRSFEEMKEFLDELLLKNNKNEKFVEGMKKILCNDLGRRKKCGNLSSSNTTNNNNTYAS